MVALSYFWFNRIKALLGAGFPWGMTGFSWVTFLGVHSGKAGERIIGSARFFNFKYCVWQW